MRLLYIQEGLRHNNSTIQMVAKEMNNARVWKVLDKTHVFKIDKLLNDSSGPYIRFLSEVPEIDDLWIGVPKGDGSVKSMSYNVKEMLKEHSKKMETHI